LHRLCRARRYPTWLVNQRQAAKTGTWQGHLHLPFPISQRVRSARHDPLLFHAWRLYSGRPVLQDVVRGCIFFSYLLSLSGVDGLSPLSWAVEAARNANFHPQLLGGSGGPGISFATNPPSRCHEIELAYLGYSIAADYQAIVQDASPAESGPVGPSSLRVVAKVDALLHQGEEKSSCAGVFLGTRIRQRNSTTLRSVPQEPWIRRTG
jgi:hypothetical protein